MEQHNTLLIMEEAAVSRTVLRELFHKQYEIIEAETAEEALQILSERVYCIAMILLSITLPQKQGFILLDEMEKQGDLERIPVVVTMTAKEIGIEMKLLDLGVADIILKPFLPCLISKRVNTILERYQYKDYFQKIAVAQVLNLKKANEGLIDLLHSVIEHKDIGMAEHVGSIRSLTKLLLNEIASTYFEYNFSEEIIDYMANACALHDIGKIMIPDSILNKAGTLTEEEFEIVKTHSLKGMEFLSSFCNIEEKKFLEYAMDVSRYHHERWDGKGYPYGLIGDEIPLCAQVGGLIDCYDALVTNRPYKPAFCHKEAVKMILNGECGVFSDRLLYCFQKVESQFDDYLQKINGKDKIQLQNNANDIENITQRYCKSLPGIEHLKYLSSAKYLDSIIIELDMKQDAYHRIYPPFTEFPLITANGIFTEAMNMFFNIFVHPEDVDKVSMAYQKYMENARATESELESSIEARILNTVNSGYSWYQISLLSLRKYCQNPNMFLLVLKHIHDIKMLQHNNSHLVNILSEIREGLELLSQEVESPLLQQMKKLAYGHTETAEGQLQALLSDFNDTVFEYDLVNQTISYSENFTNKFGSSTPSTLYELYEWAVATIHPDDFEVFEKQFVYLMRGEKTDATEFRYKNNCGNYVWCQKRATVQYNERQKPIKVIGMLMDISYYKNENAKLLEKSERDSMTGLYNKTTAQDLIEKCFQESSSLERHAMIVFDIDNFKSINDTCGHLSGDHAIQALAKKIIRYTRSQDIVGRVGGDEFILLMKNMENKKNVESKVKKFMRELNEIKGERGEGSLTVSMGIAMYPLDGNTYEELFCHADEALYVSKRCGKNQWKFYAEVRKAKWKKNDGRNQY